MTARLLVVCAVVGWIGVTLLLSHLPWFSRRTLTERLRPYSPGGLGVADRGGLLSGDSFRDIVGPLAQRLGSAVGRLFGVSEDLEIKLRRFHSPLTVAAFRTRQLGWTAATFGFGLLVALALGLSPYLALLLVFGAPLLAFLVLEQMVQGSSSAWQRRIFLELPVVTEQLGLLLSAGYSLGAALNRLSARGHGAATQDLVRVCGRIRQGLTDEQALREWADLVQIDALTRLVSLLSLNREAGDLGSLITEEARSIRQEAHRELIETIEKRAQQVWIPVTVATLLPGVVFIAVPFMDAMNAFAD